MGPIWAGSSASSQRPGWRWRVVERDPGNTSAGAGVWFRSPTLLDESAVGSSISRTPLLFVGVSSPSIDGPVPIRWAGADARGGRLCLARPTGGGSGLAGLTESISRRLRRRVGRTPPASSNTLRINDPFLPTRRAIDQVNSPAFGRSYTSAISASVNLLDIEHLPARYHNSRHCVTFTPSSRR